MSIHMNNNYLLKNVKEHSTYVLTNQLPPQLTFHNLEHTLNVVKGAKVIGSGEGLSDDDMIIVEIAALLHDIGYKDSFENHEENSKSIANRLLSDLDADKEIIDKVNQCISATKSEHIPESKLEKVMKDADMFHFSSKSYFEKLENLRQEWLNINNKSYTDLEWYKLNLDYLLSHTYQTEFARTYFQPLKDNLIEEIRSKVKKLEKTFDQGLSELGVSKEELKSYKKKLLKADGRPERGIETMFRLTSKNHISLSGIADGKANIIISVNSIIISVLLGTLMQKLDNNAHLIPPTVFLSLVNVFSIVFAVLSLRPNITKGTFTEEDIKNNKTNLLFFGNFHGMKREDYQWGMNRLMENGNFLYSNLIDDIYFLGVVLAKKYKHLRTSYNVFMIGISISVLLFILSNFFVS
ncbi:MAG: Pycsar system effector family protein [Bacteroidota bacterium]